MTGARLYTVADAGADDRKVVLPFATREQRKDAVFAVGFIDGVEVDVNPTVIGLDDGCWVQAWVWVRGKPDAPDQDGLYGLLDDASETPAEVLGKMDGK
jgi:hypothetical protein